MGCNGSRREVCVSGADRKQAPEAVLSSPPKSEFSFPDGMHVAVKRLGCSIIQSAGGAVNLKPSNREKRPSTQQHSGSVGLLILPVINRFH